MYIGNKPPSTSVRKNIVRRHLGLKNERGKRKKGKMWRKKEEKWKKKGKVKLK
jgi:hypothetical protein